MQHSGKLKFRRKNIKKTIPVTKMIQTLVNQTDSLYRSTTYYRYRSMQGKTVFGYMELLKQVAEM